jgi:2-keto-4-pentenoate hydratase/2-oxohepta-3-ene-1,7-dioic acid hydratase in catechol pathway
MRFARIGGLGHEKPVIVDDETYYDLSSLTSDIDGDFLSAFDVESLQLALDQGALPILQAADLRVGAPIARPSAVYCVGLNYAGHAAESGADLPKYPVMFMKPPNTVVGPYDDVEIPKDSAKTDWEVELGVVIGKRCGYLESPDQAMDYVAGFVLANDLSERTFQLEVSGGQWSKGKSSPGFTPLGPWLVTPDEVDHSDLRLRSFVNGQPRQDSSTKDLVFGVEHIVHHLSQFLTFEPGDVILTGTPEGVALSGRFPYLAPGDIVDLDIEGLGASRQSLRQWAGVPS